MSQRPSEPLLTFLRESIRQKNLTTAELAAKLNLDRQELKRRLAGVAPLTVDDLIQLADALGINPAQLAGVSAEDAEEEAPKQNRPRLSVVSANAPADDEEDVAAGWVPDPLGNLSLQTLRLGFALGLDMFLVFDAKFLEESGVPKSVLQRFPEKLPIQLDARYHKHNRPQFQEDGFECRLSFDAVYTCFFPWSAFRQISFNMPAEDAVPKPTPEPSKPEPPKGGPPFLRVVK